MIEREEIILKVCTYIIMIIHNYKTIKKNSLQNNKKNKHKILCKRAWFSVLVCNVLCKTKEKSSIRKVITREHLRNLEI